MRERQLDHRDVRLRVHQRQRYPGAVVEGALAVQLGGQAFGLEQLHYLGCQFRIARGRVLHGKQRGGEAAKVVPGFRVRVATDPQIGAFPVGRDHQDRPGPWQLGCQASQGRAAGAGFQRQHGRAVGDEQAGKHEEAPEG